MARCERGRSIPNASASASKTGTSCRAGSRRPMPSGWRASWGTDPPTHQGWRRSSSTRVRRSTWRALPARSPKASAGRAKSSRRARRGPRSIGYGRPLLIFPDDADHHALDDDVALVEPQRLHFLVGRLQPDPPTGLAVEAFDRGPFPMDERNHGLAGVGLAAFLNDDVVAVLDVLVDHRVAAHLQDVAASAPRQELVRHGDRLVTGDRFDRSTSGDKSEQRELGGAGLALGRNDFDRPALVMGAPDVPFALEIGEVLVNRRERLEAKLAGDFLEAGGVPLLFDVLPDVVQDLALAPSDWHSSSRRYTET